MPYYNTNNKSPVLVFIQNELRFYSGMRFGYKGWETPNES
jgi:hypothetical protein